MTDQTLSEIAFLYSSGLWSVAGISQLLGVSRRMVHWAIDESKRRARAGAVMEAAP